MRWIILATACTMLTLAAPAVAADKDKGVAALLQDMQKRMAAQDKRIAELEARLTDKKIRAARREEILAVMEEINADANGRTSLPSWLDNLTFSGDLRLRYEALCWSTHTGSASTAPSAKKRHRARLRLRFGIKKTWLDNQIEVGFRLATGEADSDDWDNYGGSTPTSANQTFTGIFSEKPIWIDRAYATYRPNALPGFWITGGKFAIPFQTSSLFIDTDVNPEGVYAQYTIPGLGPVQPFVGFGAFILNEVHQGHDTTVHGYSAGAIWQICNDVKLTVAGNVWDYDHYDDAPAALHGNTSNSLDFFVVNLHTKLNFNAFDLPWAVYFDWGHNCEESESDEQWQNMSNAYHAGVKVGTNKKKGDWSATYEYAWIEANAMPGHIFDSDFGGLNRHGHIFKAGYNITDALIAAISLRYTQPIRSTAIAGVGEDDLLKVQADLI